MSPRFLRIEPTQAGESVRIRRQRRARGGGRGNGLRAAALLVMTIGGGACEPGEGLNYPTQLAHGSAIDCPDQPLNEMHGVRLSDARRCAYVDGDGVPRMRLRGRVLAEDPDMPGGRPMSGLIVTVQEDPDGVGQPSSSIDAAADTRSDVQGQFSLSARLAAGDYLVVARDESGRALAWQRMRVSKHSGEFSQELRLIVPLDDRLREPKKEPTGAGPKEAGEVPVGAPQAEVPLGVEND